VTRGDIYRVRFEGRGHEQRGPRFAVIAQADEFSLLSTVLVIPTSTKARPATFRPEIELDGQRTRLLVEQLRVIDRQRLADRAGAITFEEMRDMDEALEAILDL